MTETIPDIAAAIVRDGFAFVRAPAMRAVFESEGLRDWEGFARSWDDLGVDTFMADGGRYRRRRFAAFRATPEAVLRKPHQPHYQSRDYNPLNGGIERWFEPVTAAIGEHPALAAILRGCRALFDRVTPAPLRPPSWHVEIHQFRIEARPGQDGRPTPEGMHRDGVDWVLVLLVDRDNIASGETSIHDLAKRPLGSFTLTAPLDAAFTDDNRVYHGVTPVQPLDPSRPGHRDVLVVTFRRE
ncbi:MAG TPA: 2OG-Fe dioxygenase family protein [Stellaceae bacterium]|nr:2OG-Fe dioxygenase family protein [Stellaceae bacterium]